MRLSQTTVTDRLNKEIDCTDCDPVIRENINEGWVTVGAIDFLVEAICDRRLRQPHFTSQLQVL
jgi:hypothetical protein